MLPQSSLMQWSDYSRHQHDVLTMTIIFFPAGGDKTSPILYCNWSPQTFQTSLQWRRGSVTTAQLAKGQCDSNTLLNKLLTVSLREMITGILLLMLLCSPPPCWLNPANRWVIGPQWVSAPTLPDSSPLYIIHLQVCCNLNQKSGSPASVWMSGLPYPKLVLCTPVEVPDGASELITVVAGLEAIPLQQQTSTGKQNNKVNNDLLDDKCSSGNIAVREKQLLATEGFFCLLGTGEKSKTRFNLTCNIFSM